MTEEKGLDLYVPTYKQTILHDPRVVEFMNNAITFKRGDTTFYFLERREIPRDEHIAI